MKSVIKIIKQEVPELTPLDLAKLEVLAVYIKETEDLEHPSFNPVYSILWGLYSRMGVELFGDMGKQIMHAKLIPIFCPEHA